MPMLLFSSNGVGTGFDNQKWNGIQNDFINRIDKGKLIELDSSHYIHSIDYERIAEESEAFIESLHRY
ncbi:hypothetical protein [Lysinibacillus sp. ACHW1.5]|nr:hypothetical protein [Lysinibacillus sp. ACHW1.5]UKJ47292.1 hypothetical protein L6W14_09655 [Lysinibacillus sp. ACHW1.5]